MKPNTSSKPFLIATTGASKSGKSKFAKSFSESFSALYISEEEMRTFFGGNPRIDEGSHEQILGFVLSELMKVGRSIVADIDTYTYERRRALRALADDNGFQTLLVHVQAAPQVRKARHKRGEQPRDFEVLRAEEPHLVISGQHTYLAQSRTILKHIAARNKADESTRPLIRVRNDRIQG